ncbi:hypothetical protein GYMLUDRAFT_41002 [Collybiopsis luxurians FD-317 M1]|uniref:Unplaced genomic scaffold GYMLUscaffold_16, whole genome shotgun sequence n=1 Tax=Collybiopsis luxurians FD-317 M1 TaxID=944289 RepID=A0A0D0CUP8_9AGAR|nr:hypothetical protein GYMLUDRAFT_41002 [Collybiopsis luxurians FD-317 M1]
MSTYNVNVSGISTSTSESSLHDFFSFCGKIDKIEHKGTEALVYFEKASAAKTALMLNGGALDGSTLTVTSDTVHPDEHEESKDEHIDQTDKPRAGIAAEYLARGYTLSDSVLQRAIEMDNQKGISKKFLSYFNSLDSSIGSKALGPDKTITGKLSETISAATQQAKTVDEQKGVSKTAHEYYTKALSSPFGKRVFDFYTTTSKQVLDIHEEAKRIQNANKPAPAAAPATETTA